VTATFYCMHAIAEDSQHIMLELSVVSPALSMHCLCTSNTCSKLLVLAVISVCMLLFTGVAVLNKAVSATLKEVHCNMFMHNACSCDLKK